MRKNQEAMDEGHWGRIYSYCYSPVVTSRAELVESLSAVPEEESWATYQWIAGHLAAHQKSSLTNDFIYANLLEVSGKKPEALAKFRALQQQLKDEDSWTMHTRVAEAVKRLS